MMNPDLPQKLRTFAAEYHMLPPGTKVLCALSGGADSMALLHAMLSLAESMELTVCAAHFNHCLRGEESHRDASFAAAWCQNHNVPFLLGEGDVSAAAKAAGKGLEETARSLRYAFLNQAAEQLGAERIATAHNADDNAETLLLHLVRGTGLRGLSGIPPRRGNLIRPLLTVTRQEIEDYLSAAGVPHVEDSSNHDLAFSRNRIRREVIPLLRELNPNLIETLTASIRGLRADQDYLSARALERLRGVQEAEDGLVIEAGRIGSTPDPVAVRVVQKLLEQLGQTGWTAAHLRSVVRLARGNDPSASLHLPGGLLVQRVYQNLLFTRDLDILPPFLPCKLAMPGKTTLTGTPWEVFSEETVCPEVPLEEDGAFYLARDAFSGSVVLRPRQHEDSIRLPGRSHRTLKKLLIDEKVPRRLREQIPVLADDAGVLALAGFGPDRSRLAQPGMPAWKIFFRPRKTEI